MEFDETKTELTSLYILKCKFLLVNLSMHKILEKKGFSQGVKLQNHGV